MPCFADVALMSPLDSAIDTLQEHFFLILGILLAVIAGTVVLIRVCKKNIKKKKRK